MDAPEYFRAIGRLEAQVQALTTAVGELKTKLDGIDTRLDMLDRMANRWKGGFADGWDVATPFGKILNAFIMGHDVVAQDNGHSLPALRGIKARIGARLDFGEGHVGRRENGVFRVFVQLTGHASIQERLIEQRKIALTCQRLFDVAVGGGGGNGCYRQGCPAWLLWRAGIS